MARTYTNTPEPRYVEKAKEAYAAGNGLPEVTATDNGKFLRVVNAQWAAAEIPLANGEEF